MMAYEKITSPEQEIENVIDLPVAPICMDAENEQLQNAEIELHCMNGNIIQENLHTLDGAK